MAAHTDCQLVCALGRCRETHCLLFIKDLQWLENPYPLGLQHLEYAKRAVKIASILRKRKKSAVSDRLLLFPRPLDPPAPGHQYGLFSSVGSTVRSVTRDYTSRTLRRYCDYCGGLFTTEEIPRVTRAKKQYHADCVLCVLKSDHKLRRLPPLRR